jgi:effector-binding domain-containing protein
VTAYDVKIEQTAEFRTAVVKARTTMREFPSLWPALLDEVWPFIRATPGLWTDGHNVFLYRSEPPGVELAVEIGVQVTASFAPAGRVVPSMLPASEAATTIHAGPPAGIGSAHQAVREWCAAHGRALSGVWWEIYGDPRPSDGQL